MRGGDGAEGNHVHNSPDVVMSGGICDSRRAPCAGNAARAALNSEVLLVYLRVRVKFVRTLRSNALGVSLAVLHPLANPARSVATRSDVLE